jgi:hypothetical protein
MTNDLQAITPEGAKKHLLDCYKRGGVDDAKDALLHLIEDPIQPLTDRGTRRFHPLLWTVLVVAVCGIGVFLYFTVKG